MKWLVTAFEPFNRASSNSSLLILNELEKDLENGVFPKDQLRLFKPVPVSFEHSWQAVEAALASDPDINGLLALGQSEGRHKISLEHVALNWADTRIADNAGKQLERQVLRPGGPEILWTKIPWHQYQMVSTVQMSHSAGVYVCNQLFYDSLNWANKPDRLAGFVHIPVLDTQTEVAASGTAKMNAGEALSTVRSILKFLLSL